MHVPRPWRWAGCKSMAIAAACVLVTSLGSSTHAAAATNASATLTVTSPSLVFIQGSTRITVDSNQASVSWSVTDDQRQPVRSGTAAIAGGSGKINLDNLGPGYYNLSVRAGGATRTTSFGVLSALPAGPRDQRFGVGMHLEGGMNSHWVNDAGNVGFGAVRTDVSWGAVEQTKGVYTYPAGEDTAVSQLHDLGIKPLLITDYRNPFYDDNKTPSSPAAQQAFANFSSNILDHYGYATNQLEVYNEFNGGFNDGACGNTPDCYLPLLAAVDKKVKADHPNAAVVGPALAGIDTAWLDRLFQLGGLGDLDAVTVHTYTYPSPPEGKIDGQVAAGRSTIDAAGGKSKEMWLDESGWSTFQGSTTES
ncbi:MAG: hypothetical protein J2P17_05965, partial [Mycobacterium sp.]|nr:hypothetical protein [Mycobacterium sp.]